MTELKITEVHLEAPVTARELVDNLAECPVRDWTAEGLCPQPFAALRAVLDLHVPEGGQHPDFCGACMHQMPCATVTAITAALEPAPGDLQPKAPLEPKAPRRCQSVNGVGDGLYEHCTLADGHDRSHRYTRRHW